MSNPAVLRRVGSRCSPSPQQTTALDRPATRRAWSIGLVPQDAGLTRLGRTADLKVARANAREGP
jgi:hypothetical protein